MNETQEQIEINVPLTDKFNISDVKWKQQGYYLIGTLSNGVQFGTRVDNKLRLIGVDENNKPKFKELICSFLREITTSSVEKAGERTTPPQARSDIN